jgi:hypothetical protein
VGVFLWARCPCSAIQERKRSIQWGMTLFHQRRVFNIDDYRGTSLIRKRTHLGPYRRPMPKVLRAPGGVGVFL